MNLLDRYTFHARLMPVFILLLPFGLAFFALFPAASLISAILALLGTLSVQTIATILLSEIGRDAGKKKEPWLYERWGGTPTDLILLQPSILDPTTIKRYKDKLAVLIPEIKFPAIEQEMESRAEAIGIYRSCTNFLREQTRDTSKFTLLFKENVSYGFRRNLWGMKPAGVLIALIGTAICTTRIISAPNGEYGSAVAIICLAANVVLLVWWMLRITPTWVRIPANEYAKQLFATCEVL